MNESDIIYKAQGQLGIIALQSSKLLGQKVDDQLKLRRSKSDHFATTTYLPNSFNIQINELRFSNGEGKVKLVDSVRGRDIYILCDIGNYSCTYQMYGRTNFLGPDEHFQDIKRTISAIGGKSRRTTVIMPLLYASRQHRRKGRESLDCAIALQELERMGVKDIISFDVHDPNIQNAVPLNSFENIYPTYDIVKTIIQNEDETRINKNNMLVISPDTGAMDRAIYYSSVLKLDIGMFYKRRDHTKFVEGKNPIIEHEYMGGDIAGKDVLIVDDILASGESVLDIAKELKSRGADKILVAATFALFTEGTAKIEEACNNGLIHRIYSTNLTYVPENVLNAPWYRCVDMSICLARLIDYLNYNKSISPLVDATKGITKLLEITKKESK